MTHLAGSLFWGGRVTLLAESTFLHTAISRKVAGKSTRDDPERYIVGGFEFTVVQKNLEEWHKRL